MLPTQYSSPWVLAQGNLGSISGMPQSLARSAAKTLAVAMLAVLAALQGGPLLLVVALALSAVGDAFLSRDGEKAFLGGLASFLVAHIVYIALFLRSGGGLGLLGAESWRGAIALALAVFVVVMSKSAPAIA